MKAQNWNYASWLGSLAAALCLALSVFALARQQMAWPASMAAHPDATQVHLQLRVAEINHRGLREVSTTHGSDNTLLPEIISLQSQWRTDGRPVLTKETSAETTLNLIVGNPGFARALYTHSAWRELTAPNAIALQNQKASFLAGGAVPIPVLQTGAQGPDALTALLKELGVRLNFQAALFDDRHLRLALESEVISPDFDAGVTIQGLAVPGLRVRRAKGVLELRAGQSFALAGLLDADEQASLARIPALNATPLLGDLLKSRSLQDGENELLFLVTVNLGAPEPLPVMAAANPAPSAPPPAGIAGEAGHIMPLRHQYVPAGAVPAGAVPAGAARARQPEHKSARPRQNF